MGTLAIRLTSRPSVKREEYLDMGGAMDLNTVGICSTCGAVSVVIDGDNFSMPKAAFDILLGFNMYIEKKWVHCDYCVNDWGIDICACGSGEHYTKCTGFKECGAPYQVLPPNLSAKLSGTKWDQNQVTDRSKRLGRKKR